MMQVFLFYSGDTSDLLKENEMAMNDNGDNSIEKGKVLIKTDPM
jgi:hypothetical protein